MRSGNFRSEKLVRDAKICNIVIDIYLGLTQSLMQTLTDVSINFKIIDISVSAFIHSFDSSFYGQTT